MSTRLNPYLEFDGDAREAMEFYASVFDGELSLMTFGEMGVTDEPQASRIMHGQVERADGLTLMGADTAPGNEFRGYGGFSVSLSGDDEDTLRGWFEALAERGTVEMPLEPQMWGDTFGSLTDEWGVVWIVNIAGEQAA